MARRITNKEALKKAVIALEDLAEHGKIPPQEAEMFLDYVRDETSLGQNTRFVRISKGDEWRVNKIGVGRRNLVPARGGVDPGVRRGITTNAVELATANVMLPFDIIDDFIETNIEGESVEDHIVRMMATSFANDSEELLILGDKNGPAVTEDTILEGGSTDYVKDPLMSLFDGILRLADGGNVNDVEGANFGVSVARQSVTSLPTKFRRNRGDLRLIMPSDLVEIWRERQSSRETPLGDSTLGGGSGVRPFGLNPAEMALLPMRPTVTEHLTLSSGTPVSLRYQNVTNVVVTPVTLGATASEPYTGGGTDYTADLSAGTITAEASLDDTEVKVTYNSPPQLILTPRNNIIVGVSRDVRVESMRDIYRQATGYAITTKIGVAIEELDAVVKIINLGEGV